MTSTSPPLEVQRFGRSQTPESPRPVHIPEPSNIPVLHNMMDPVFNDTATYNIRPSSQPLSPTQDTQNRDNMSHVQSLANRETVEDFLAAAAANAQFDNPTEPMLMNDTFTNGTAFLQNAPANTAPASTRPEDSSSLYPADQSHTLLNSSTDASRESPSAATQNLAAPSNNPNHMRSPATSNQLPNHAPEGDAMQRLNAPIPAAETQAVGAQEGVDYQSLLDQISQSTSTVHPADSITTVTTVTGGENRGVTERPLPAIPGLPPKPPPQDHPVNFPKYPNEPIRHYPLPSQDPIAPASQSQAPSQHLPTNVPSGDIKIENAYNTEAINGFPPPPSTTHMQNNDVGHHQHFPAMFSPTENAPGQMVRAASNGERPWPPEVQIVYDQFLQDERNYVTEGVWDRFPVGSRLFVGNLPTEKVTKRDLFHVFHRHGRLAQISIKQAYGFVQYLEAASCFNALAAEQGVEIRGRKIHLEISKPQRNTRNAGGGGSGNKSTARKRSRSPDRGVARGSIDQTLHSDRLPFSDFRDEPGRKRDDYRPRRSPSPRGYRARDEYRIRDRSPASSGRYGTGSRSPAYGSGYRAPSPKPSDDDASLSIPRRDPRDVPDIQILILEEVAQQFVNYVEQGFRQKGLRAQTTWLNPRVTLVAVIKRQIIEGVQAVVKLTRSAQYNSKIPLQVFDRGTGTSNVNFNEYVELDIAVAADIVIQARQKERMTMQSPMSAQPQTPSYPPNQAFNGHPQYNFPQQPPIPQQYQPPTPQPYPQYPPPSQFTPQPAPAYRAPTQAPPTPSTGAPNLQELLANLRQPSNVQQLPQQSPITPQNNRPTDLAGLLSNVAARQHNQNHGGYNQNYQTPQPPAAQYVNHPPTQGYQPQQQQGVQAYGSGQQQPQQNVQNVMDQLARYTR